MTDYLLLSQVERSNTFKAIPAFVTFLGYLHISLVLVVLSYYFHFNILYIIMEFLSTEGKNVKQFYELNLVEVFRYVCQLESTMIDITHVLQR